MIPYLDALAQSGYLKIFREAVYLELTLLLSQLNFSTTLH